MISVKSYNISAYVKNCILSTVIYLLERVHWKRYLSERINSLVGHFQFMVEQKHNLVGHLILPQIFAVGQNVRFVFCLVGQFWILVGHCPMPDRYFKA